MERNNFISRIKVEQNINYNKLIWFQKEIEQFDIKKIHCLIPILKKHNLPESLYVTDFDTYCLLNAYLKKLGVKVYFKRYGFEQNKMNCDLANFISSYFKNETQINIPFSTYLSKTLDFIRQCYLEGYDPDFNILSNNEDDYYKFIINNDNKLEHNLVS